ncbi:hypothetical protein AVDCRST_MAG92-4827 [uncultured Coleofasciculus sp.]|uniref:Uncharacterized protein n=1 Tax=uncultured Coleofasciculus sp. TaxID=1267456 RepID=A0A6J4K7E2_9CYAN|nr:hypothetical protein AVDCRST_MAG92-4827 [uncultured Coleofasciculus sp.]
MSGDRSKATNGILKVRPDIHPFSLRKQVHRYLSFFRS